MTIIMRKLKPKAKNNLQTEKIRRYGTSLTDVQWGYEGEEVGYRDVFISLPMLYAATDCRSKSTYIEQETELEICHIRIYFILN